MAISKEHLFHAGVDLSVEKALLWAVVFMDLFFLVNLLVLVAQV
jgi:hypothetical protein